MTVAPWPSVDNSTCRNCGAHITDQFRRVFGDDDDRAHRCGDCDTFARLSRGSAAGVDVGISDPEMSPVATEVRPMSARLEWPDGFERTPTTDREDYPHWFRVSRSRAFDNVLEELRKMDARNVQVETAAPHTKAQPHRPYADRDPDDSGVVVYFERDGRQFAIPCDRWDCLRDNAQAIAKYLNAKRALERYGIQIVESEFSTQALPSADEDAVAPPEPPRGARGCT